MPRRANATYSRSIATFGGAPAQAGPQAGTKVGCRRRDECSVSSGGCSEVPFCVPLRFIEPQPDGSIL